MMYDLPHAQADSSGLLLDLTNKVSEPNQQPLNQSPWFTCAFISVSQRWGGK